MAPHDPGDPGLNGQLDALFEPAYRLDFYQAVRLLELIARERRRGTGEPDIVTPGAGTDPDDEPVRFRSRVTMAFPASDLSAIDLHPKDGGPPVVTVDFMGLAGARGPLPHFWAELVRERDRLGDTALRAFLDLFNHRLISLLYRARQRHRPALETRRLEEHPFSRYLLSFAGLASPAARASFDAPSGEGEAAEGGLRLEARDLMVYAGLLWNRDRSMVGLERLLAHALGLRVRGRPLVGRWLHIPEDERTRLSVGPAHNRLGVTAVAGRRIWDPQAAFELRVGPLAWDEFVEYLPCGRRLDALAKLVRFYVRSAFDFYLVLVVRAREIPPNRPALSARGGPRLGWTSWLVTRTPPGRGDDEVEVRVPGRPLEPAEAPREE